MELKDKQSLARSDLKHNFLKTIIIRFDFNGISEVELDSTITDIKPLLYSKGYDRLSIELATEMDFQLGDPERAEMEGLPIQGVRRQRVYVFKNQIEGIQLKISPVFAFIFIEKTRYIDFKDYSKTLVDVVRIIRDKIPFFNTDRFGLRKINQCIFTDPNIINDYFEPEFFKLFKFSIGDSSKLTSSKDCFIHNDYNVNSIRTIIHGEWEEKEAYQVVLDSDVYLLETDIVNELIDTPDKMNPMNELLFDLYKAVLTDDFIRKLQGETFSDTEIIGVECNE